MSQTHLKKLAAAINRKYMPEVATIAIVLVVLGSLAASAQQTTMDDARTQDQNRGLMKSTKDMHAAMATAQPSGNDDEDFAKLMEKLSSASVPDIRHDPDRTHAEGLVAWREVYSVLTYPRCINCHTATDHPDQGDDRHRHAFNVVRGPDGKGVPGLNCVTCHQGANSDTGVPGAPGWRLAPLSMTWQDSSGQIFSSAQVCKSLTDRSKNGNLGGSSLLKHHEDAPLVLWAFEPGRIPYGNTFSRPPLTHEQFVTATRIWVEAGTPCPVDAAAVKNLRP